MAGNQSRAHTPEEVAAWKAEILERIADAESVRAICRDEGMPAASTVFKWLAADEEFARAYAFAKEASADAMFEDILDIADEATPETVQVARLRVDTKKWAAGKMRPKKYGDKLELAGGEADGSFGITFKTILEK